MMCSHCSAASFANSRMTSRATSQMSLFHPGGCQGQLSNQPPTRRTSTSTTVQELQEAAAAENTSPCKICLMDTPQREMVRLQGCGCAFCAEVRFTFAHFSNDRNQ